MKIAQVSAVFLKRGDVIMDRKEYHITVEDVRFTQKTVRIEGVDGWGDPRSVVYKRNECVAKILSK